jgi:hypothetical protein
MVQLAEERNYPEDGDRRQFDAARQEMLNHATIKVNINIGHRISQKSYFRVYTCRHNHD